MPRAKTNIINKNYLSFTQANAYLSLLISLKMLSRKNGTYETTDRGHQFLSSYTQVEKILASAKPITQRALSTPELNTLT